MSVTRTGDWRKVRSLLARSSLSLKASISEGLRKEAHALRKEIVEGITRQAPGGKSIEPPSSTTLAARRRRGFGGTKALIVRSDLRNGISVLTQGDRAFVGVLRKAKSSDGQSLVDVAEVQEFGSRPTVVLMTDRMRRFLFALLREAKEAPDPGAGQGVVVIQVPPRPYLRPAFETFKKGADRRLFRHVARSLGLEKKP